MIVNTPRGCLRAAARHSALIASARRVASMSSRCDHAASRKAWSAAGKYSPSNVRWMKSRPSRFGEHSRSTSSGVSRTSSFATIACVNAAANARWSLASTWRPVAFSVYATTPLPENASTAGPGGSVANTSARRGARRCLEPMNRIRG